MAEFQVRRDDFRQHRVVDTPESVQAVSIGADEVLVGIERFAFTANNITYAAAGDQLGYWQFFPPSGPAPAGWGVIPVWGFAQVVVSNVDDVPIGERLFGYFPARDLCAHDADCGHRTASCRGCSASRAAAGGLQQL